MSSRKKSNQTRLRLEGSVWIKAGEENLGGPGRIALLRAVAEQGSITQAAKAYGMSYKAAWDAIDAMNRVAGEPLVERSTGGRGGGSTRLTERGARLVERYTQIEAVHRRFLGLVDAAAVDLDREFSLLDVINMKASSRNQFQGVVTSLREGAVNDEVEIEMPGGQPLVAIIPRESTAELGLRVGVAVMVLIQSSNVLLATGLDGARVSARNQLAGKVKALRPGAVNAEVELELAGGSLLVATVTQASVQALGLKTGSKATALVKASDLVLAVLA
ncbi:TOBE domain-containing protein [Pelomonas sp. SE-A7]|uniref:TOBE domain-containing protein n=1 Tax=Pelomonas sp. SE-A7 TaxID=3054953 RepID=UPI00259C9EB9|nr:TOBE domain-containing protein [Pelomonas sp. SE-A7]MDM4768506.1 TOBE domain-containing protein [Pelomonas sp. SE-A7]